jgi:hypothetical protein
LDNIHPFHQHLLAIHVRRRHSTELGDRRPGCAVGARYSTVGARYSTLCNMNSARTLHRPALGHVRPPNGTLVEGKKPVWHGGNPYEETTCNTILAMFLNGDDLDADWLIPHRHQHTFLSLTLSTCRRIWARYINNGHVLPNGQREITIQFAKSTARIS